MYNKLTCKQIRPSQTPCVVLFTNGHEVALVVNLTKP